MIKRFYQGGKDTVHLNEEGIKLLCGNIAYALHKQNGINPAYQNVIQSTPGFAIQSGELI